MEHHLSLGAHLLAWVFPLLLVVAAIGELIWCRINHRDKS